MLLGGYAPVPIRRGTGSDEVGDGASDERLHRPSAAFAIRVDETDACAAVEHVVDGHRPLDTDGVLYLGCGQPRRLVQQLR